MDLPDITITSLDHKRLTTLLDELPSTSGIHLDALDRELARAKIVPSKAVSPDVVTMNSSIRFEDELSGIVRDVTLVYPDKADKQTGRVSVLSPLGSILLGLRVGQTIECSYSNGRRSRYRVLEVTYQPEAAGHFEL